MRSFIEDLTNTIVVARQLLDLGQTIDLTGFDGQIGLLCAKALDLPPKDGRSVRADLIALLTDVESLHRAMQPRVADT